MTIAGRRLTGSDFVTETIGSRRYATLEWDGLDFAGRPIGAAVMAHLEVCRFYELVPMLSVSSEIYPSWGMRGGAAVIEGGSRPGVGRLCTQREVRLGGLSAENRARLGGLTLSAQHHFDYGPRVMHSGSGYSRQLARQGALLRTQLPSNIQAAIYLSSGRLVVTNGSRVYRQTADLNFEVIAGGGWGFTEGALATDVSVSNARSLAEAPDGSIVIGTTRRIVRLGIDGRVSTIAGNGGGQNATYLANDAQAQEFALATAAYVSVAAVAVAPDGTVYFTDLRYGRVRKVRSDGRLETVAGGGGSGSDWYHPRETETVQIDGGWRYISRPTQFHAREVVFPYMDYRNLAVLPNGDPVFRYNTSLVAIRANGLLEPLTGGIRYQIDHLQGEPYPTRPSWKHAEDRLSASLLNPGTGRSRDTPIYVTRRGTILFLYADTVYELEGGTLRQRTNPGETGRIFMVQESPDGSLSFGDRNAMFLTSTVLDDDIDAGFGRGVSIPSADGALRFVFDDHQRHRQTLSNRTGQVLASFSYDVQGRLEELLDADGLRTEFTYAPGEIRILAPYGETTVVQLTDGLASRVHYLGDPHAAAHTEIQYEPATDRRGLVDAFIDRRGQTHDITLDSEGALTRDALVEMGSSWDLVATHTLRDEGEGSPESGGVRETTVTSALGRTRTFRTEDLRSGIHRRTVTAPSGAMTVTTTQQSGLRTRRPVWSESVSPNGATVRQDFAADPQEGWRVPMVASQTLTLPSGESTTVRQERDIERRDGDDSSGHVLTRDTLRLIREATGGDRVSQSEYQHLPDGTATVTTTSAEGRQRKTYFDSDGRITRREWLRADGTNAFAPTTWHYDGFGRLTEVRRQEGTGAGADYRSVRWLYTDADVPFTATERGYPLATVDGEDRLTRFTYDVLGRQTGVESLGDIGGALASAGTGGPAVGTGYDVQGLGNRVTPPGSGDHQYVYDGHNALNQYNPPALAGGATPTNWTTTAERGEVTAVTYADGSGVDATYHGATGLLSSLQADSLAAPISLAYDPTSAQVTLVTMPQHPQLAVDGEPLTGSIDTAPTYDGPVVTGVATSGLLGGVGGTHQVRFDYDPGDGMRLRSIQVDDLPVVTRSYDHDGVLTGLNLNGGSGATGTLAMTFSPNPDTGVAESALVGVVSSTFTPNAFGEIQGEAHSWPVSASGATDSWSLSYTYDHSGRLTDRATLEDGVLEDTDFVTDTRGRLTKVRVDGNTRYQYTFDDNGNRIGWNTPNGQCVTSSGLAVATTLAGGTVLSRRFALR